MHFCKIIVLFSLILLGISFSPIEAKKLTQEKNSKALSLGEVLEKIDDQIFANSYSQQLYKFKTSAGTHRLLIVNNPELKTFQLGNLSLTMRMIVGFDADLPDEAFEQIKELFEDWQIKGILYSSGTFNGKTIFELFGY